MSRAIASCLVALAALLACGCGPPRRGADVKAQMKVVAREESAKKLYDRGRAFASVGDLTRGEQYLRAAIDAGADETVVTPVLLRVLVEARDYRAAVELAEGYLQRHPADNAMRFVLATLDEAVGEGDRARAELKRLLTTQPENADAHYTLAVILRDDAGDPDTADLHFRAYLRLRPNGPHADEARGSLVHRLP